MKSLIEDTESELKRADHLIYVSLKYTRTCDVFKSIIDRLVNAIDFMIDALLLKLEEDKKITEKPAQPKAKSDIVRQKYDQPEIKELCDLYLMLRQLNKAPFTRAREYRRHVTMTCRVESKDMDVNIDNITEYYKRIKSYFEFTKNVVLGESR